MKKLFVILMMGALGLPMIAGERLTKSDSFSGVKDLKLKEISGDLAIKGANVSKLSVTVSYNETAMAHYQPVFKKIGNKLYLTGEYESGKRGKRLPDPNAKWEIIVPMETKLSVQIISGMSTYSNLNGDIDIKAVSGDISMSGCQGQLWLESSSGDIELKNAKGVLRIKTVSGDLMLKNVASADIVENVSGKIEISNSEIKNISSVSGNITLTKCENIQSVSTVSANVYASCDTDLDKIKFSTVSGSLRTK